MASKDLEGVDLAANLGKIYTMYVCGFLAIAIILMLFERLGVDGTLLIDVMFGLPFAIYLLTGFLARTAKPVEFYAAGRIVPGVCNGMAMAAANLPAVWFTGLAGTLYVLGYDGLAVPLGVMSGFLLAAVLFAPSMRKSGALSVADFLGARFGPLARVLAAVMVVACSLPLLIAAIEVAATAATTIVAVPYGWAVSMMASILLITALFGGMKGVTWAAVGQCIIVVIAYLLPLFFIAAKTYGAVPPQLAYGATLNELSGLEMSMLEKGLADASTFKPYLKPFLQLDRQNFFALLLCLALGTAAMPHVLQRSLTASTVRESRFAYAWAAFFVLLIAVSAPAYAVLAKREIFSLIVNGTAFADVPSWLESASQRGLIDLHGVSLRLLDDVIAAVGAGAGDVNSAGDHLQAHALDSAARWAAIKDPVRSALLDVAKSAQDLTADAKWAAFRNTILPAAALAAGNKTGLLTHGAMSIDAGMVMFALPKMAGLSGLIDALLPIGAIAAALALAGSVLVAISTTISHDLYHKLIDRNAPDGRRLLVSRLALLVALAAATWFALQRSADILVMATWPFSLAAAGLFPALVLGIWCKRANAWGAVPGMAAAFALCLYYLAGTHYFAADFYDAWSGLSNASASAAMRFADLKALWSAAEGDAKSAAWEALEGHARGTATKPGIANWFGLYGVAAAVFAVPVGLLAILLVSLVTPRPPEERRAFVDAIRKPRGPVALQDRSEEVTAVG